MTGDAGHVLVAHLMRFALVMGNAFRIGRIFGIELRVDPSWIFIFVIVGWSLTSLFASWHPRWLVGAGIDLATRWLTLVSSVRIGSLNQLDPLVWLSLGVAASPFLAWGIVAGWRRLERTLIFIAVRPGA